MARRKARNTQELTHELEFRAFSAGDCAELCKTPEPTGAGATKTSGEEGSRKPRGKEVEPMDGITFAGIAIAVIIAYDTIKALKKAADDSEDRQR